jgi:hypothetical protein
VTEPRPCEKLQTAQTLPNRTAPFPSFQPKPSAISTFSASPLKTYGHFPDLPAKFSLGPILALSIPRKAPLAVRSTPRVFHFPPPQPSSKIRTHGFEAV